MEKQAKLPLHAPLAQCNRAVATHKEKWCGDKIIYAYHVLCSNFLGFQWNFISPLGILEGCYLFSILKFTHSLESASCLITSANSDVSLPDQLWSFPSAPVWDLGYPDHTLVEAGHGNNCLCGCCLDSVGQTWLIMWRPTLGTIFDKDKLELVQRKANRRVRTSWGLWRVAGKVAIVSLNKSTLKGCRQSELNE